MSSLTAILDAMREALNDVMGPDVLGEEAVQVVSRLNLDPQAPTSVDIYPADPFRGEEAAGFGDRVGELIFTVRARVTTSDTDAAQEKLLSLLDDESALSVAAALEADPTLDGVVSQVHVDGDTGYRVFDDPPGQMLGVAWRVRVLNLPPEVEPVPTQKVLLSTTNISAAELLDLFDTPIALVDAPGAGKFVLPIIATTQFVPGSTPYAYAGGNGLTFGWPGSSLNASAGYGITDTLDTFGVPLLQGVGAITFNGFASADYDNRNSSTDDLEDQPFQVSMADNPVTDGDGSLVITLLYSIADVS